MSVHHQDKLQASRISELWIPLPASIITGLDRCLRLEEEMLQAASEEGGVDWPDRTVTTCIGKTVTAPADQRSGLTGRFTDC